MLAIIVMVCAKASAVQLIIRLGQRRSNVHAACRVLGGAITLCAVFSIFSFAFQREMVKPWAYAAQRCAGSGVVWYPVVLMNPLTDAVLFLRFALVLCKLKMNREQRLIIASLWRQDMVCLCSHKSPAPTP